MSHIQEIENLFDELEVETWGTKRLKDFLRSSHLKYLQNKRKELEGEMRPLDFAIATDMEFGRGRVEDYRLGYNLAKQEEIDKIDNEIKEI